MLALPAGAGAATRWERLADPPGGMRRDSSSRIPRSRRRPTAASGSPGPRWTRIQDPNLPGSAFEPQIAFFGGRPYVAYIQHDPGERQLFVVRLNAPGTAWERNGIPPTEGAERPRLAASGGRLYVAALGGGDAFQLLGGPLASATGRTWSALATPSAPGGDVVAAELAADRSSLYAMWGEASSGAVRWHVARLAGGPR